MRLSGANVFVTGVTGLIGGEFVRSLLNQPVGKVWTLIRPTQDGDPTQRLADRMRRAALGPPEDPEPRLRAVGGDVAYEQLGLTAPVEAEIRQGVDVIVHCAAVTSFIQSRACRRTNIIGAEHLIDFAKSCARRPLFVYVSTAYVSGTIHHACVFENGICSPDNDHHNEYTRSKAVAEALVRSSGLNVLVVRPSIVFSAGLTDPRFARAILWFMPLLNGLDAVPVDPEARMDAVPVQFVVESLIRLLQAEKRRYDLYHISAGDAGATRHEQMRQVINRFYERKDPIQFYSPTQWTRDMHREYVATPAQRKLFSSLRKYLPFLNMDVRFDNQRLREDLGLGFPELTPVAKYLPQLLELVEMETGEARWG